MTLGVRACLRERLSLDLTFMFSISIALRSVRTVPMHQPVARLRVRKRRWGYACTCYACGADVYPEPLGVDIDPDDPRLSLPRGYAMIAVVRTACTHQLRLQARLFCPTCAGPDLVRQNERLVDQSCARSRVSLTNVTHVDVDAHSSLVDYHCCRFRCDPEALSMG